MAGKNLSKAQILRQFDVNEDELKRHCQNMGVKSLAVFGSVIRGGFQDGKSDIDFLVEFESVSMDIFFDFLDGLKSIFHYEKVDLVTASSLKNRVIRAEILASQENIYAA